MTIKLTQADVGKEFITRGGQIAKITKMSGGGSLYPFEADLRDPETVVPDEQNIYPVTFTESGRYSVICKDEWDLVRPASDEASKAELKESVAETSKRIKADIESDAQSSPKSAPAALVTVEASLQDIARLEREYTITRIYYKA